MVSSIILILVDTHGSKDYLCKINLIGLMDSLEFNGHSWAPCRTYQDEYSFFHAVFGQRSSNFGPYKDLDAKFRLESEEIPMIATLENVKITIYNVDDNTVRTVEPSDSHLGDYPLENREFIERVTSVYEETSNLKYNKLSGSAGIKGGLYQVNLLTIVLLNGLNANFNWQLSTENSHSGKFDDLVFQVLPHKCAFLLQAKHKKNKKDKITYENLLSTNSKKDDFSLPKYFFSYHQIKNKFKVKELYICTNVDIQLDKMEEFVESKEGLARDSMLYYDEVDCDCYTFKSAILPKSKLKSYLEKNLQDKNINPDIITEENVQDFLDRFRFIANYPKRGDLDAVIEKLIVRTDFPFDMKSKDSPKYVIKKMIEWFEDEKGVYHTKATARALFSEIVSNKLCEKLQNCGVSFKINLPIWNEGDRILHIVPYKRSILNMIKVCLALQETDEQFLFVNPFEDWQIQKRVIEAFWMPHYTDLVVCLKGAPNDAVEEIGSYIKTILRKRSYKKVILIAEESDKLPATLKRVYRGKFRRVNESITFSDLTEDSQRKVLEKVIQLFHKAI
ncbi:hypothetical protein NQ318_001985 [Aromia moschata]|uniref:Uncharacterized protein n=1 Tax=Aromia moschata TaxID=1265417 RepID=A0AAV8Z3W8_9CUCU|nr:hypothetical protein NQ318_001985 [Aromia moschata]